MPDQSNAANNIVLYSFVKRVYRFVFIAVLGLMVMVLLAYWVGYRIDQDLQHQENLQTLRRDATTLSGVAFAMRDTETQFLLHKNLTFVQEHRGLANRAMTLVSQMGHNPLIGLVSKPPRSLNEFLQQRIQQFDLIIMRGQKVGLTEKFGLHYKLRLVARSLEKALNDLKVDALLVSLLMMRRHEKDFLTRGQKMSLVAMNQQMQIFSSKLRLILQVQEDQYNLNEMLQSYWSIFMELAKEKNQLAQDIENLKRMSLDFRLVIDNTTALLRMQSENAAETLKRDLAWFKSLLSGFALLLILVIGLQGILIIRQMTKADE
ncbi:MAG: hypothetical protein ABFQ95_04460 [Pseudomonadota bacterium]